MIRSSLLILASGMTLAFLSSAQAGRTSATYSEIMGCEVACDVAAAGWPAPYLVDYPGISVVGSADLSGALLGEDRFRTGAFFQTLVFWTLVSGAAWCVSRAIAGRISLQRR
jgi:hypothetical protein